MSTERAKKVSLRNLLRPAAEVPTLRPVLLGQEVWTHARLEEEATGLARRIAPAHKQRMDRRQREQRPRQQGAEDAVEIPAYRRAPFVSGDQRRHQSAGKGHQKFPGRGHHGLSTALKGRFGRMG